LVFTLKLRKDFTSQLENSNVTGVEKVKVRGGVNGKTSWELTLYFTGMEMSNTGVDCPNPKNLMATSKKTSTALAVNDWRRGGHRKSPVTVLFPAHMLFTETENRKGLMVRQCISC
jgi:hypothetical protein